MEVLSPSKKHTTALEMVSEEEEDEAALESEHEEGEISSEDEEDVMEGEVVSCSLFHHSTYSNNPPTSYASHFSFPEHRSSKKSVASEVIIYDDNGRTIIFTSPEKPRVSSYPRAGEVSRQHSRELPRRKEKEGDRSRRHHVSSSLRTSSEKWPKASRRSAVESKGPGLSQEGHTRPYKGKVKEVSEVRGGHRQHRSRPSSPDTSSRSSSCSSCSSSSSYSSISCILSEEENDASSVSPCKGRGKENRRCGPVGKGHDRPHSLEYGCEPPPAKPPSKPPPPPAHRPKHSGSQHSSSHYRPPTPHMRGPRRRPSSHHSNRRSPKESVAAKATHRNQHQHQPHHRTHQKPPPKARPSVRKDTTKPEKSGKEAETVASVVKGQNRLPRGSLGEMLLSRPKVSSTHPMPSLQDIPCPAGEDPKTPVSPSKAKKQEEEEEEEEVKIVEVVHAELPVSSEPGENSTLDQEDDEELQLRLIAIQSSLRLLTDMQKDGETLEEAGEEGESSLTSTPKRKTGSGDKAQEDMLKGFKLPGESRTPPVKDAAGGHGSCTSQSRSGQDASEADPTLSLDVATIQISDDIISISSSSASEICVENLATNTSYLEAAVDEGGGRKAAEDNKRKGKERLDVDQDPVDMEICDSSGEEEGGQAVVVQDSPLSPEPGQDSGTATAGEGGARPGDGQGGVSGSSSNFQIPVEWAYMMPPPPPPDQPANDLQNINSWCFDQNMYLQAMQGPSPEQQQQQHGQGQGQGQEEAGPSSEWPATTATAMQPHTSSWPDPFMEAYNNSTLPQDTNTPLSLPMGLPPDQQQQQQHQEQQHQQEQQQHQHQQEQQQHQHHQQQEYFYSEPALPQDVTPSGHGSDLKNMPAEQYQAFMSAVLQQQQQPPSPKGQSTAGTTFTECPQRNLIMVPLNGSHQPSAASVNKGGKKAKAKKLRNKKRLRKRQMLQEFSGSGGDGQQQVTNVIPEAARAAAAVEEEDEDLLRAQLLIDMSRKKEQRLLGATTTTATTSKSTALPAPLPVAPFPAPVSRATIMAKEGQEGRASPQTLLHPSDAVLAPRSLRIVKGQGSRPRSGENSPTHSFRGEGRQGLSDIGGWGLDPKGSKFNYHSTQNDFPHSISGSSSSSTAIDFPKVKFPPIEPVIIPLLSDSDDSTSEGEGEGEVKGPDSEPMSQSIDNLLKSMRNANTASTSKEPRPASPRPGPSTPSAPPAAPSGPSTKPRDVADCTPQAVRHLSRPQQEEYRRLKEQLRKKMLQRKQMQQRPVRATSQSKLLPPPPPTQSPASPDITQSSSQSSGQASPVHADPSSLALSSVGETSSSTRAVTWKDMGLLQIQVHNDAALDVSSESNDSGFKVREAQGDSSANTSAVEDEDEETLRMMALLTQKKKKTESSTETQRRRVIVGEQAGDNAFHLEAKDSDDLSVDSRNEEQMEEGMKGEWMVLDEVREEGTEAGEEELCARPPGISGDEVECGEGTETSDDVESVTRSPGRGAGKEMLNGERRAPRTTDKEAPEKETSTTNKGKRHMQEAEASQDTTTTTAAASEPSKVTPQEPASEGGSASQSDNDMKQDSLSKPDTRPATEPSCNGEKIEKLVRRIENKTKVLLEKSSRETSPAEVNRSVILPQGSVKKQVGTQINKSEIKAKATDGMEIKLADKKSLNSHSEDANSTLATPSHTTTTTTTTTTVSTLGTLTRVAVSQNQSKAPVSKQNGGLAADQRTVIASDARQKVVRKIGVVRQTVSTAPAATVTAAAAAAGMKDTHKPTKVPLQLKKLEKDYKEKKNGINKMIVKLGQLLKEVNEEQLQRQDLKNNIAELQMKLKEMESQLESKSSAVQTKMELIRRIQVQLGSERQALTSVERQGEMLGQQVYGNGYNFTKSLPLSPRSKVKDISTKKNLASSISALRQQVRDLTNKRKNTVKTSPSNSTLEAGVARKQGVADSTITPHTNTQAGMVRTQSTADNTMKTTITTLTTSMQGGPESKTVRGLNLDAQKETTSEGEKAILHPPSNSPSASHSPGVSRIVTHASSPTNTQGKGSIVLPRGKSLPVKRKVGVVNPVSVKAARVQGLTGGLLSAVLEKEGARLASRPRRVTISGAKEREKLDEMKALCPHDLLGRCNDASCQYQHLPSAPTLLQAQTSPSSSSSSSQQPQIARRGSAVEGEPHATTTTTTNTTPATTMQGKAVPKAGASQVKVLSGGVLPKECSSEEAEVKSQLLLPDVHVSEQQQEEEEETQTAVGNVIATPSLLETAPTQEADTQASTQTETQTDAHNSTTDQLMHTPNTTDTQTYITLHQTETPTPTDLDTPNNTLPEPDTQVITDTDMQTERPEPVRGTSVGLSLETSSKETRISETEGGAKTDTEIELQTHTATTDPQEIQTETEVSVGEPVSEEPTTSEAQNATATESRTQTDNIQAQEETVTEPQTETEASTAQTETQTCITEPPQTEAEAEAPQTVPGSTESQIGGDAATTQTEMIEPQTALRSSETQVVADDRECDAEMKVPREQMNTSDNTTETEDKEWSPSDLESLASTSSTDYHPSKRRPTKTTTKPAKRRASTRRSTERNTEETVPNQSEGEPVTEHQEETRVTRKSLRVKAKTSPKATQPLKSNAKGKGQKRKSEGNESPSMHPSGKKRYPKRP